MHKKIKKLNLEKKIFYWSPFLVPIATPRAVINSAYSMKKFSKKNTCYIINFFGEFNVFKDELYSKNVTLINYFSQIIYDFLPKHGKIQSRFSFLVIFFLSFFPLKNLISKKKPDYLVIHLITSLPLILLLIFKFRTKFILRISGLPKLGFFRKLLWRITLKKIYLITCPSQTTLNYIKSLNIVDSEKVQLLYDPIIDVKKIFNCKKNTNDKIFLNEKDYYFAAGRLTKQKNFIFLCKAFKNVLLKYPKLKLVIAGDGEDKAKILSLIKKNKLESKIFLIGHVQNIFYYISRSKGFILSSLWEDPGFVLVEAAFCRVPIISSNCGSGPKELIKEDYNGILFNSNDVASFVKKFDKFLEIKKNSNNLLLNSLKMSKKFTLFNHCVTFEKILNGTLAQ